MIQTKAESASVILKNFVNPVRFFLSSWVPAFLRDSFRCAFAEPAILCQSFRLSWKITFRI
ncbi:MAG: hypothetical protein DMF26_12090 [Verrucomicrobia bacterium]|nr:MAG: hypothetical protein DMF26_12090 [Verrucomicrobiota bacterium]